MGEKHNSGPVYTEKHAFVREEAKRKWENISIGPNFQLTNSYQNSLLPKVTFRMKSACHLPTSFRYKTYQ